MIPTKIADNLVHSHSTFGENPVGGENRFLIILLSFSVFSLPKIHT